ncbi:hypothetical protein IWZ01DRAFT_491634 [Phyllosticta capitalensis]
MSPRTRRAATEGASKGIAFGDLPPEMLMSIISHIDNEADLLNLSLVSKQVNALVQPTLYSSYLNFNMEVFSRSITPFLRNILNNESLARACKRVDLGAWNTVHGAWEDGDLGDCKDLSTEDFELFVNAAKDSNVIQHRHSTRNIKPWRADEEENTHGPPKLDTDQDFLRTLRAGMQEPQLVTMLSCLPRMEELCLRGVDFVEEPSVWKAMTFNTKSLKKLTLSRSPETCGFLFEGIEPVLQLPSLRELRALGPAADKDKGSDEGPGLDLEKKSLSLTHITLEGAAFTVNCMSSLIAACKHLVQFTYTIHNRWKEEFSGPDVHFTIPQLKQWLLAHKDSLKHLTIDFNKWPYANDYKTIGSMEQFTALETYAIDYGALRWHPTIYFDPMVGVTTNNSQEEAAEANLSPPLPTLFPSSLRELTIFHSPPMVVESLMALQETPVEKLPCLDRINLHFAICTFHDYPLYNAARDMLQAAGIRFSASQKYPRKTLEQELMDNGDFFRTRWDETDCKYISAPAKWDEEDQPYQRDLCAYHSEMLPREFERTLNVSESDEAGDFDGHLLDYILDHHGIGPYMHGFFGGDEFDFDDEFDEEFDDDDDEILDDMDDFTDDSEAYMW